MRTLGTESTLASPPHSQPAQHWNLSSPPYSSDCHSDAATHPDEDLDRDRDRDRELELDRERDLVVVPGDEHADAVRRFNDPALPYASAAYAPPKLIRTNSAFSVRGLGQQETTQQSKISSVGVFEPALAPTCAPIAPAHPSHSLFLAAGIPPPQPPSACRVPIPHHAVPIYPASLLNPNFNGSSGSSLHIGFNRDLATPSYNMATLINAAPSSMPTPPLPMQINDVAPPAPALTPAVSTVTHHTHSAAASSVTERSNEVESDEDYDDAEEEAAEAHSRPSHSSAVSRRKRARNSGGSGNDHTREAHVMTDRQRRAKIKTGMDSLKLILKAQGMVGQDQASITLNSVTLLGSLRQELQGMHSAFSAALQELERVRNILEPQQPQLAAALSQRVQQLASQRQQVMYEATQSRLCGGPGGCPKSHAQTQQQQQQQAPLPPSVPTNVGAAGSKGHHHPPGHGRTQHAQSSYDPSAAAAPAGVYRYAPALKMEH